MNFGFKQKNILAILKNEVIFGVENRFDVLKRSSLIACETSKTP
jgi:hypothetical protein